MSTKPKTTICLSDYRSHSFKAQLQDLYADLEKVGSIQSQEDRFVFVRKAQGRFIFIFRQKNNLHFDDVTTLLGVSSEKIMSLEHGESRIDDQEFFKLCQILGATNEISIFLEKLEEAFRPGLCERRDFLLKALSRHGISFVSHDKCAMRTKGQVLIFTPRNM